MARPDQSNRSLRAARMEYAAIHAELLVRFLNAGAESEDSRLWKLFGLCRQLNRNTVPPTLNRLMRAINDALREFQFRPALGVPEYGRYRVGWVPAFVPGPADDPDVKRLKENPHEIPTSPTAVVKVILDMVEDGALDRIRQCFCGRWFFATTNKKRVCSDACRFQKFKHGDAKGFRDQRAEYMREYRKNPKVKAKRRANGNSQK
jgi:hypothetical protein